MAATTAAGSTPAPCTWTSFASTSTSTAATPATSATRAGPADGTRRGRSARLRHGARAVRAVVGPALDLDVPRLPEALHRRDDEERLHRHDQQRHEPERARIDRRVGEARLVALEPLGPGDRGEDEH